MFASGHGRTAYAVGVDAGGTRTRIARADLDGRVLVRTAPSVPVRDLGAWLRRIWRRAGWTRRPPRALVVASRGVWSAGERAGLARAVAGLAARVAVISDAEAALRGALGDRPGLLVLAGTGSIVVGRSARGRLARSGGLGPLLGDEGSGFWLGREWLRRTAARDDARRALRLVRRPDAVARIAALAPGVLRRARAGDARARAITRAGAAHLAAQAADVARRLGLAPPITVSWAGSVMNDARYRAAIARALGQAGVRARWRPPDQAPIVAAARLAARLAGSTRRPPALRSTRPGGTCSTGTRTAPPSPPSRPGSRSSTPAPA
jgi:N-acetylglucosamine kinase-like BadF-type ATPase